MEEQAEQTPNPLISAFHAPEEDPEKRNEKKDVEIQGSIFSMSEKSQNLSYQSSNSGTLDETSKFWIVVVECLSVVVAVACTIYFITKENWNVAFEYGQIGFVSTILLSLDGVTVFQQRGWVTAGVLTGILWNYATVVVELNSFPVENCICATFASFLYVGGILYSVVVINKISTIHGVRNIEIDLLLYLIGLNAICFFNREKQFNSSLHMMLDLRTIVVLFNGFYQLKNKLNLLKIRSFTIIVALIIINFLIYSEVNMITDLIFSFVYVIVGCLLFFEAWYIKNQKKIPELFPF